MQNLQQTGSLQECLAELKQIITTPMKPSPECLTDNNISMESEIHFKNTNRNGTSQSFQAAIEYNPEIDDVPTPFTKVMGKGMRDIIIVTVLISF